MIKKLPKKTSVKFLLKAFRGFSLLELSVVIVISSLLLLAMLKGGDYLSRARKTQAMSQTKNSEISRIDGMVLWLDAVSPGSFDVEEDSLEDGVKISSWKDVNSQLPEKLKIIATQLNQDEQPIYISSGINKIPSLSFDGIDDGLAFDAKILNQTDFTIFVVEQRNENGSARLIGNNVANGVSNYSKYSIGYEQDQNNFAVIFFGPHAPGNARVVINNKLPAFLGEEIPRIHAASRSKNKGSFYYVNGIEIANSSIEESKNLLSSNTDIAIGRHRPGNADLHFKGEIGEIIIFSRLLKDSERILVENYLKRKWRIS